MKVLFLTLSRINNIEDSNIYTDLLRRFEKNNHEVYIVCPTERKFHKPTSVFEKGLIKILKVWTPNIQKTNFIEKTIGTLLLEYLYFFAINKYFLNIKFDLKKKSTPPNTLTNIIKKIKYKSKSKTYLLLKDIFPQNAIDLGIINKKSLIYKYFRSKEIELYNISDHIGCMSIANVEYILNNNKKIDPNKVEVNPNCIEVGYNVLDDIPKEEILSKFNIPSDKIIYVYGGNLGLPQGINYIVDNIKNCLTIKDAFFLIIGDGTEYENLNTLVSELKNVLLIKELPKRDYDQILKIAHVGLIFLNPNFTIPNFPSRILSYMENKIPIILATDDATDIGFIAEKNKFGFACNILNKELFANHVNAMLNEDLRLEFGTNAFKYLKEEYSVEISYNKIISKISIHEN